MARALLCPERLCVLAAFAALAAWVAAGNMHCPSGQTENDKCKFNPCLPHDIGICTNTPGIGKGFRCSCPTGAKLLSGGIYCGDVDECSGDGGTHNCDANAECTNTPLSFACTCNSGYSGNGRACTNIDECADNSHNNCHADAICTDTPGSYNCECKAGFTGNGVSCTVCPLGRFKNITGPGACILCAPGTYKGSAGPGDCTPCSPGYNSTAGAPTCVNINECTDSSWNNCHPHATCSDTTGSFTCTCSAWYNGNGVSCTLKTGTPQWSSTPSEIVQTTDPFGVDVSPDGTIIIADNGASNAGVKLRPSNGVLSTRASNSNVKDTARELDGSILFVSGGDNALWRIPSSGSPVKLKDGFSTPTGVAVAPNNDIIVAWSNGVSRCPQSITLTSGSCVSATTSTISPNGVDVAQNGDIIVVDHDNHKVARIPAAGGSVITLAQSSGAGVLRPRDVVVTPMGHIVFAQNEGAIKLCKISSSNPNTCASVDTIADGTKFGSAMGVALAPNGDIIVADADANKISRLAFSGTV